MKFKILGAIFLIIVMVICYILFSSPVEEDNSTENSNNIESVLGNFQ